MANKLRVSPEAREDLQDIWDYLSQFNVTTADQTVEAIADAYRSLLDAPFLGVVATNFFPDCEAW